MRTTRKTLSAFLWFLFFCVSVTSARATIILVAVRDDGIWVSADGYRSGDKRYLTVCKIHEAFGGILLKYGNDADHDLTYSTDDDVRLLVKSKQSFAAFMKPAADILRRRVNSNLIEVSRSLRKNKEVIFYPDNMAAVPFPYPLNKTIPTGLVFINVEGGLLTVHELEASVSSVPILTSDRSTHYRWVVKEPVWKLRKRQREVVVYGADNVGVPPQEQNKILAHPETLSNGIENARRFFLRGNNCAIGPPYATFKITVPILGGPSTGGHVEPIDPGACPSWEAKPIPAPLGCPIPN